MTTSESAGRVTIIERRDGIAKVELPSGEIRYRVQLTVGQHADGRRQQVMRSFKTKKQAVAERDRVRHERGTGTLVRPQDITVRDLIAEFVATKADRKPSTRVSLHHMLRLLLATYGDTRVQDVSPKMINGLKASMQSGAARSIGRPGTPLAPKTINATIQQIRALFEYAVRRKLIATNPCADVARVAPPTKREQIAKSRKSWGEEEGRVFLEYVRAADPDLFAPWVLTMMGLRRGEVLGLAWDSVCLDGSWRPALEENRQTIAAGSPFIEIVETRTLVDGEVIEGDPKTDASTRALPLTPAVVTILTEHHARQVARAEEIGSAWTNSNLVAVDTLGAPLLPGAYSHRFLVQGAAAGLPRVVLHGCRNLAAQILENSEEDVPHVAVQAWLGHARPGVTAGYSRSTPRALAKAGRVLTEALGL